MILDALEQLAKAQAVTATDANTTNTKDLGNVTPKRDIGDGEPMCLLFTVDVAAAGSTDTTDLMLVQSVNADLTSYDVLVRRRVANASLTAGARVVVPIAPGAITKRYIGGRIELGTGDTITVSCWLQPLSMVDLDNVHYATGITIA